MEIFSTITIWHAALFTLKQALVSSLIALVIGLPLSFFVAKRRFVFSNFLSALTSVPFCVPSLLVALGFVLFFGINGVFNDALKFVWGIFLPQKTAPKFIALYSFWGIVFTHGLYNFPIIMGMCADAWKTLPRERRDAAELLGAKPLRIFCTITLRELASAIASSFVLVFLYCFFSFIIVLLFGAVGVTTLELEMYQAVRSSFNINRALLIALIETTLALLIVFCYGAFERFFKSKTGLSAKEALFVPKIKNTKERVLLCLLLCVVFVGLCGPLFCIAIYGVQGIFKVVLRQSFFKAFFSTLSVGCMSAFGSVLVATLYGFAVHSCTRTHSHLGRRAQTQRGVQKRLRARNFFTKDFLLTKIIPLVPLAISPIALGVVIIACFGTGSVASLVCVQIIVSSPLAYRQIDNALKRIPSNLQDASLLLSKSTVDVWWRLYLPFCKDALVRGFLFCFAISASDASAPLLLAIPHFDSLALTTYRLAGAYRFAEASGAGFILGALTIGIFALANFATKSVKKIDCRVNARQ